MKERRILLHCAAEEEEEEEEELLKTLGFGKKCELCSCFGGSVTHSLSWSGWWSHVAGAEFYSGQELLWRGSIITALRIASRFCSGFSPHPWIL
jgi:hypothetical protein